MLTGCDEAEGESSFVLDNLFGYQTAGARVVEALKAASEATNESYQKKNCVLVCAENGDVGKKKCEKRPDYGRVENDQISANFVAEKAARHLGDRVAVEKT